MPILQIRSLPKSIYEKLKNLAQKEHRSLSQQAIVTLEKGLANEAGNIERRTRIIGAIKKSKENKFPDHLESPLTKIRRDRHR